MLSVSEVEIVLLGTGGGRFVTMTQKRRTAGMRLLIDGVNVHVDPGPGALVYSIFERLDPQRLDAVLVSHCHPDHYTDAEVLVEAMARGMTRRHGTLLAGKSVISGSDACGPSISKYHQHMTENTIEALPGMKLRLGSVDVLVTEARHTDPEAVGFRFEVPGLGAFAYTSDTEYFEGIGKYYGRVRLLILCVMRPAGKPWKGHMTTDDAIKIVEETRPEQALLTHLGMKMLAAGPEREATLIQERTGVPTVAARDGMRITLRDSIVVRERGNKDQLGLGMFL